MALFRTARPASLKIGCFGKLASYGDFVSLNQDSAEAREFAEWMHQGMTHLAGGLPGAEDQFVCFSWRTPESRRRLLGIFWPSRDSAGRSFPFSLFISAPGSLLDRHGAQHAHALEPLWRQLHELYAQVLALDSLADQYTLIQDARSVGVPTVQDADGSFTQRSHAVALEPTSVKELGLEVLDVRDVGEQICREEDAAYAVRLRIHNHADPVLEAAVWTRLLLRDRTDAGVEGSLFLRISPKENSRSMFLSKRAMRPEDLGFLFAPDIAYKFADSVGYRVSASNEDERKYLDGWNQGWEPAPHTCARLLDLGLAENPADVVVTAPMPAPAPVPIPASAFDDEITGEIDTGETAPTGITAILAATAETAPGTAPLPPALFPTTSPVTASSDVTASLGDESTAELSKEIQARVPEATASRAASLTESILTLLAGPVAPGAVVRLPAPEGGDGEGDRVNTTVFVPEGSKQAHTVTEAAQLSGSLAMRARAYAEIRRDLTELRRVHRDLEDALEARLREVCDSAESQGEWL